MTNLGDMKIKIEIDPATSEKLKSIQADGDGNTGIGDEIRKLGQQILMASSPVYNQEIRLAGDIERYVMELRVITEINEDDAYWLRLLIIEAIQRKAETSVMSHRQCMDWYCGQLRDMAQRGEGDIVKLIERYKESLAVPKRFDVGDGQTEIVTNPAVISWNEVMQGFEDLAEKVAQFGRDMEQDKIKARQRVKDDVRRKRKDVMRRRKL